MSTGLTRSLSKKESRESKVPLLISRDQNCPDEEYSPEEFAVLEAARRERIKQGLIDLGFERDLRPEKQNVGWKKMCTAWKSMNFF